MIPGDPVTVNGLKEGKVVALGWHERDVKVTAELNDRVQLYEDAEFIIVSAELLAGMRVEILPGKSRQRINMSRQPFRGRYGGRIVDVGITIDEVSKKIGALTIRMDTTMGMLNSMLSTGKLQKDIGKTLSNVNNISNDFRKLLGASSGDLQKAIKNFETGTEKFNRVLSSNEKNLSKTLRSVSTMSSRLDTISTSLKNVMVKIEHKEGTLGKMVYDTTMYNRINNTLSTIDSLARQIKDDGLDIDLF
jgi:phospholipid/cholesterol/gamma-HCH transport system substrate-binding protein